VLTYLSPEQALGGAIDSRTDVFSLGVLIYEMLTGRNPFAAPTPAATVLNVIQGAVPSPSEVNGSVPAELDRIVAQTLARDLSQRQQSAALLASELRRVMDSMEPRPVERHADSSLLPLDERPDKSPAAILLLGGLGAAAAAAALVWWLLSR
jgi:serine/threonine protein kinase